MPSHRRLRSVLDPVNFVPVLSNPAKLTGLVVSVPNLQLSSLVHCPSHVHTIGVNGKCPNLTFFGNWNGDIAGQFPGLAEIFTSGKRWQQIRRWCGFEVVATRLFEQLSQAHTCCILQALF